MRTMLLGLAVAILAKGGTVDQRQPVLVELFTSEGCSSCPPADALLVKMDREQPVPGAQIIVLSEHVDYWNHDGWTDPFSSAAITHRQETYDRRFGLDGPYTPEMIVDGTAEFNGSDPHKAESAIRAAAQSPKVGVRIRPVPGDASVTIEVDPLPAGPARKANVYVAHAADTGASDVLRGENQGRHLQHVAILKDIHPAGKITDRAGFQKQIPAPPGARLVVIVQDGDAGTVYGAALYAK
ncbi:MAG: DUF1223 domain-containing protein [Bryobacteraceae bacterium]